MLMTGIVGLYVGRIHAEVKRRPLYVVADAGSASIARRSRRRPLTGHEGGGRIGRMAELFDKYDASYGAAVQSSIEFSGLPHSFFLQAKADLLRGLVDEHVGGPQRPQMLDVGCGVGSFHPYLRGMADRLCGIDVSAASIAQAQRANPAAEYRVFDGGSIPYDDRPV